MFAAAALPVLPKASGERSFLLVGLEFGQQQSVPDTNLLGIKRLDDRCGQLGEFEAGGYISCTFACLRGNLFGAVLRLVQIEKGAEALRFF